MSWQINHIESNYIQDSYYYITWQYAGLHEVYTILAACNGDTTNARHQAHHCADLFSGVRADATQKLPGRAAAMPAGNHIRRQENTQSRRHQVRMNTRSAASWLCLDTDVRRRLRTQSYLRDVKIA